MEKQIVNPAALPPPSGFSHGILTQGGKMLFLAGQPGLDAKGRVVAPGDMVAQFAQAVANLQAVLQAVDGKLTDIVKLTIYVTDKAKYQAHLKPIGETYRSAFGRYYPATTFVEVKDLFDRDALVELDAIAVLPEGRRI
jgi:enamine deaminase RidA (YjgF/YER057c/UK114 family)